MALLVASNRHRLGLNRLSKRGSLAIGFLLFEATLDIVTEAASVGHHFTGSVIGWIWGIIGAVLIAANAPQIRRLSSFDIRGLYQTSKEIGLEDIAWGAVVAAIVGVLATIAWIYPPSNGDSLVYHLPRVEHWIQDRSVAHFATQYLAQIELSPLAEFNIAHVQLLSGEFRLDGYVQLCAAVICIIGVSEIARLLGGSRWVQLMSAVICATIPSGILEAPSTQDNYFAAAIGVGLLIALLNWSADRSWFISAILIGFGAGLAIMAKGTLPALIAPVAALLVVLAIQRQLKRVGVRAAIQWVGLTGAVGLISALSVYGPFLAQNYELFGSPVGPVSKSTISVGLTPRAAAANVLRSTAGNFMIGNGKSGLDTEVSRVVLGGLGDIESRLGVAANDPRYSLGNNPSPFAVSDYSAWDRSEDTGANPWDVLLIVATLAGLTVLVIRGRREFRRHLAIALALCAGYLLFTATSRWSVFVVRYEIPLLVAWSPLIAIALGRLRAIVGRLVLVGLLVACMPQLFNSATRSLLHPSYNSSPYLARYLVSLSGAVRPDIYDYEDSTAAIAQSSCQKVGLANWVLVEFLLWAGLQHDHFKGVIEDVDVPNQSAKLEQKDFVPCALILQETSTYVAPVDGMVHLLFGQIEVALDPSRVNAATTYPGFVSQVPGVSVLPGGGWRKTALGPTLARRARLFLLSRTAGTVRLELNGLNASPPAVVSGNGTTSPSAQVGRSTVVTVHLVAGANTVSLSALPHTGDIDLKSVTVVGT